MLIRVVKIQDATAIAHLMKQLGYPTTPKAIRKRLKTHFSTQTTKGFLAFFNKKPIGFISLHLIPLIHEDGFLCRLTSLIVDKKYRGKGIGKKLVKTAEIHAIKKGAVRSEVTSSIKRNEAHQFYKSTGYQEYRKRFIKLLK